MSEASNAEIRDTAEVRNTTAKPTSTPARAPRTFPWWSLILVVVLWAVSFPQLDQYNVTWDEALGDLFFGQRYLSFFTSFDPDYLEFTADPYPADHRPDLGLSPFRSRPWEYYPVANTLAAATSWLFSSSLGWLDPFDGFHAVNLILASIFLVVWAPFVARRSDLATAIAACILLFSHPRLFAHLLANIKDIPLMFVYTLTLVVFHRAWERGSVPGLFGAGVMWGLTLGCKANALFLPGIPLLLLLFAPVPEPWRGRRWRLAAWSCAAATTGVVVMVAVWPYLWADPIGRILEHLRYIGFRGDITRPESLAPVAEAILLTTPLPLLIGTLFGVVVAVMRARRGDRFAWLLLVWPPVVLGRYILPQAVNFDGVRHFLELFPAMTVLAALGWTTVIGKVFERLPNLRADRLRPLLLALILTPSLAATVGSHPFQLAWWNPLIGGYAGARATDQPQAGDYWGTSYRLGLDWLNEHAPRDSLLAVPVIEHAVRLVASERLRRDIQLLPLVTPYSPVIAADRLDLTRRAAADRPLFVMFVDRRDWWNELMAESLTRGELVQVWELEDTPVLYVFRYHPPPGTEPYRIPPLR